MTALSAAAVGALFGAGIVVGWRALWPRPLPLNRVLAALDHPGRSFADHTTSDHQATSPMASRLGQATLNLLDSTGLTDSGELRRRLRALDQTPEQHAFRKLVGAIAGTAFPVLLGLVLAVGGVPVSVGWVALATGIFAVVGFFVPDLGLADQIEARRREFAYALSAYLDLVTIILAGGGGLETALQAAADAGDGWAFAELRLAVHRSRMAASNPWDAFDVLGRDLGVDELREVAVAAHLAGDHGARIRSSLTAKADTLRANLTALSEAQAEAATEKMLIPAVGLVVGMVLFIGFGAVGAISAPALITP